MANSDSDTDVLISRSLGGDDNALKQLFSRNRRRLETMVSLRIDRRLQGRINVSDLLNRVFDDLARRLPEYKQSSPSSFFIWLRSLTASKLTEVHRQAIDSSVDSDLEVSLYSGRLPRADSVLLASQLLGKVANPGDNTIRADMQIKLQQVLNTMASHDRELLALKHFEDLDNAEIAAVLGIPQDKVGQRYLRALRRLRQALERVSGLLEND